MRSNFTSTRMTIIFKVLMRMQRNHHPLNTADEYVKLYSHHEKDIEQFSKELYTEKSCDPEIPF